MIFILWFCKVNFIVDCRDIPAHHPSFCNTYTLLFLKNKQNTSSAFLFGEFRRIQSRKWFCILDQLTLPQVYLPLLPIEPDVGSPFCQTRRCSNILGLPKLMPLLPGRILRMNFLYEGWPKKIQFDEMFYSFKFHGKKWNTVWRMIGAKSHNRIEERLIELFQTQITTGQFQFSGNSPNPCCKTNTSLKRGATAAIFQRWMTLFYPQEQLETPGFISRLQQVFFFFRSK